MSIIFVFTTYLFFLHHYFVDAQDQTYLQAQQKFSLELFSNVSGPDYSAGVILSPIIIDFSLSLLLIGSSGNTFKQLLFGLQYPANYSINLIEINSNLMIKNMINAGGIEYGIKIYVDKKLSLQNNFKTAIQKYFNSGIETVDFAQKFQSVQTINDFISNSTHGMIQNVMTPDELDSQTSMILVNCIYFKGAWVNPFNKNNTEQMDFKLDKINTTKIDFMKIKTDFKYGAVDTLNGAKVVELPYVNSSVTLTLILPQEVDGLKNLITAARNYDWSKLSENLKNKKVLLIMPKFNATFGLNLNQAIENMGMDSIFYPSIANIDRVAHKNGKPYLISLEKMYHKVIISVDEYGTTAAAVSTANKISTPVVFQANQPFLYALRSNSTIYFIGQFTGK
ncbi:hypothetical protein PVAND_015530 [Polypedilum vanderplanki]|uniref:Serpin domain-containing protein n=1 Tax=Polypedilum vanderplanki TaxID=319348 RepID=A0A9J6BD39_POLVA|nr:hypothetical protein PVAND_015530 [Polypedilum vanderplanki]